MIRCTCPACRASLELPDHLAGTSFHCPSCGQAFAIPKMEGGAGTPQTFMERMLRPADNPRGPSMAPPPSVRTDLEPNPSAVQAALEPTAGPPPRSTRADSEWDPPIRRRPEHGDRREEDSYGDFDDEPRPTSGRSRDSAARAAVLGISFSLLGLLITLAGIFFFTFFIQRERAFNFFEALTLILALGAMASFVFSLLGVVFSSRGLDRSNDRNRGMAIAGLVTGILGLVLSIIFGSVYFLCGIVVRAVPF